MKTHKSERLYQKENANYCISMMWSMWYEIQDYLYDEYGYPMSAHQALSIPMPTNKWYVEGNDIITVYFPTKKDIEFVKKIMTFGRITIG